MRLLTLIFLLLSVSLFAQNINTVTTSVKVLEKIEENPEDYQPILILLENQVNFSVIVNYFDENNISVNQRPKIVMEALQNKARNTQNDLLLFLENSPNVLTSSIRKYWVANTIFAKVKPAAIANLSHRNDVAFIQLSGQLEMETIEIAPAPPLSNTVEAGLEVVGAPFMWAMGYTGYGQLAFTNDTGIDRFHPSYENKYRGLYSDLSAVWFDYDSIANTAILGAEPHDCNGHGTHVTGTILGLDRRESDTIGVAFNAHWIGAAILCGIGTADNVASFEWSLNPDGNMDTFDDIPDIINNSWYDPSLDELDCTSVYVPILEAMEAAGIAVIFSAGNEGAGSMTITQPHNININLVNSFTVGALNGNNSTLPIANFSSRGPSHCGGEGSLLIKPEVSAPGVNVRSARPNGTYGDLSGTSMASPHVSGCVLLLKEAFPELTAVELKESLYFSAIDLGVLGEDNTYGMGVINLENAFNYLLNLGHIPVSPYRNNDVLLIDFDTNDAACENEILVEILVENAGLDSLFSFKISYDAAGFSQSFTWTGALASNERTTVDLPPLAIDSGEHIFHISVFEPNGLDDERPLNNRLERLIYATSRPYINAFAITSEIVCEGSNALLRAESDDTTNIGFLWYESTFGSNPIAEGSSYLVEDLVDHKTYYASAIFNENIGEKVIDLTNYTLVDSIKSGLIFDAHTDFVLKSILVYADQAGVRQINLRNAEDNSIGSNISILDTGFNRINLNFNVTKGQKITLEKGVGKGLATNAIAANFPYQIEGVVTIHESTEFSGVSLFPMFYDWEIEYESPCARTPIMLEVSDAEDFPMANFSTSKDTVNLFEEDAIIQFTDNSTDATEWLWYFDDGTTSNEANPIHEFTETGEYLVSLTVTNSNGCTNSFIKKIVLTFLDPTAITPSLSTDFEVAIYPNPVSDNLQIAFFLKRRQPVKISLVNAVGQLMREDHGNTFFKENLTWDMSMLNNGVYYLILKIDEKLKVEKVIKME